MEYMVFCPFVGKSEYFLENGEKANMELLNLSKSVEETCYCEENIELGRMIYELYRNSYQQYLEINDFDRILFGVV